jgi:sugar lactone lactonase YvrE
MRTERSRFATSAPVPVPVPVPVAVAAVFAAAVLGLAACGGSSKKDAPTTTTTTPSGASTSASATPSPTDSFATTTVAPTTGRGLSGIVTVVAGSGKPDGGIPGPAESASLGSATQFAVAPNGDIYVSNGLLDVLKVSGGQVSVFAHLDPPDGPGSRGIAVAADGSVFVATPNVVDKFSPAGARTVVLRARDASLPTSLGPIAIDPSGRVYVGDGSPRVLLLAAGGRTTPIAGTASQAPANSAPGDNGPATAAALGTIAQIAIDGAGDVLIADTSAHRVRRVTPDGTITTIAGGGTVKLLSGSQEFVPDGTKPTDLELSQVSGLAVDAKGRIYVADAGSQAIFRFAPGHGIELVAGDQEGSSEADGLPANQTRVTNAGLLAIDGEGSLLYLLGGVIHRLAGAGS